MAEPPESYDNPTALPPDPEPGDVPVEEDLLEEEAPRRAASAEFIVESEIGSQALLREAMDPANQSLRDALRLSFRVLQAVILVLIVLFFFSGFQTVKDGESGVMLRWGKILGDEGAQALEPGLKFSKWPYPAGEFVLFNYKGRRADIRTVFWPSLRPGQSFEDAVEEASTNAFLRPSLDGSLLTADGDVAHMQLSSEYDVEGPVAFLRAVENKSAGRGSLDADRLVTLVLQRAMVHTAARMTVDQLVAFSEQDTGDLLREAQTTLDRLMDGRGAGIRIAQGDLPIDPTPPLAIRKAQDELQNEKQFAREQIEIARAEASKTLLSVAGEQYQVLLDLIEQYEEALDLDDTEQADALLAQVNERMESPEVGGEVAQIINFAKSYSSQIESTLGAEARRFASLLPQYREHPQTFVNQYWSEVYKRVLTRADAERFYVPDSVGNIRIALSGYDQIRQVRRDRMLNRAEQRTMMETMGSITPYAQRVRDMERRLQGKPGRQLTETGESLSTDR